MNDEVIIQASYGAARLKVYPFLRLINLETQVGRNECEIELTADQAKVLASKLIEFSDHLEDSNDGN